ncbi:MAG: SMP-30/gluconolactonase/LRE family protein [Deltaproteobacteria bacterium]|nr:SMP-30/gluconolactonase/LRE family protein [Deltaproteobacteria bacterium]
MKIADGLWLLLIPLLLMPTAGCPTDPRGVFDDGEPDPDDLTDDDDSTDPVDVDCTSLPDPPLVERTLDGPRATKGLAIGSDGRVVGSDDSSLIKSTYDGDWEVFLPGIGTVEGMLYLPDGDLVITSSWDEGDLRRISPDGGITVIASALLAYSVIQGPDGMLYAAGWDGAFRVDPDTGAVDTLIASGWDDPWSPRTLAFSEDGSRLFVGTVDEDGRIFVFDLDEDFEPTGPPAVHVTGVGNGWHDGLGIDACGNLWTVDFESSSLYRVSPEGDIDRMVDWSSNPSQFGHGLIWGSGTGGWRSDALYLPVPEGGDVVKEVIIGVPEANR